MWSLKQFATVVTTRVIPFAWAKPTVSLHAPRCSIVSLGCALFVILRGLERYQNVEWLMKTNAPDRDSRRSKDEKTFLQRYTPRRKASVWSEKNTQFVQELIAQGRMRPRGQAEINEVKADGPRDRACQGQATTQVPDDLQRPLDAEPAAKAAFKELKSQPRYHILHQLMNAKTEKTRATRIARFIAQLNEEAE